jgi:hypothetical protein
LSPPYCSSVARMKWRSSSASDMPTRTASGQLLRSRVRARGRRPGRQADRPSAR